MTTITLHDAPTWRAVARQQVRAAAIEMRRAGAVLFACLLVIALLTILGEMRKAVGTPSAFGFTLDPVMTMPVALFGLFAAGGIWQREEPSRRAYHLAMPVSRATHTWLRVGAGWVWLMASVAAYLLLLIVVGWAVSVIGHGQLTSRFTAWAWIAPFAAATMVYLLVSIAMVAAEQPLIWIIAAPFGVSFVLTLPGLYKWREGERLLDRLMQSPFNPAMPVFPLAATGGPDAAIYGPNVRVSLLGVLFWTAVGIAGVWLAARRRPRNVR
jgi:hypothetical protein